MEKGGIFIVAACVLMLGIPAQAGADEGAHAQLIKMVRDLQTQMQDLGRTIGEQNKMLQIQQSQIEDLKRQTQRIEGQKARLGEAAPQASAQTGWLEGLDFGGDVRLRYEGISQHSGGTSGGTSIAQDRNRFRYRLRYGFVKTFNDEMKAAFRLASGSDGEITSRNQTFDSQFSKKDLGIDRVYATYTPNWAKWGRIKRLEITGGKFANPLYDGSTNMIWDSDITPEGLYEKLDFGIFSNDSVTLKGSFLAGQFVIEESATAGTSEDAELYVYQGGFQSEWHGWTEKPVKMKNMFTWYDYDEISSPGNFGAARGNFTDAGGLSAESFDIIEVYNEIWIQSNGLPPVKVFFDWAKNTNEAAIPSLGGGQDKAWYLGTTLGKASGKGTWAISSGYYWIEANAVPGIFTDSEFGTADSRGGLIKFSYGLTDFLQFDLSYYFNNRITGDALTADRENRIAHADLVWKI